MVYLLYPPCSNMRWNRYYIYLESIDPHHCLVDCRVPIIALTANATLEARNKCTAASMDDYLTKPFSSDDLYGILERIAVGET